ncbi:MAG: BCD family MFS transporter [Alphaproteobacteria bacterium]|nr:BCD family MFS transporter [Alphaproteobacteria bacterium]
MNSNSGNFLGWFGIFRLGLVQTALGAIVVLTTSTINRVMVVELALPAVLPGLLVGLHYAVQLSRPRWGHGSDVGGRRTPFILGGMAVLAFGGVGAAFSVSLMESMPGMGTIVAVIAFLMIGVGVGAAGTTLLVLLAKQVAPERRAAAATIVWVMMIAGFIVTAATAGHYLDPYSAERLLMISSVISLLAFVLATVSVRGVEWRQPLPEAAARTLSSEPNATHAARADFVSALREVWAEDAARNFTIFVFVSMLAYSAQDLILEPYAGLVFGFTPGESTKLAGTQHGGVLAGMILIAGIATLAKTGPLASLRMWTVAGCLASALALSGLAFAGTVGAGWPLSMNVFLLGLANGAFAVAAIGSMMARAGSGANGREGMRMGLWGAAQAIAFGLGGFLGAAMVDVMHLFVGQHVRAYGSVFSGEAALFLIAALLALRIGNVTDTAERTAGPRITSVGKNMLLETGER